MMPTDTNHTALPGQTSGLPRLLLQAEGAAVFALAFAAYWRGGSNIWLFWLLLLAPDLSAAGYLVSPRLGSLFYNAGHTYLAPALLFGLGWFAGIHWTLPACLIWTAHIGMDRCVGYGLKYPGAFRHTHLSSSGMQANAP